MIGKPIRTDPYHVSIVRTPLTRNLGSRFEDIADEIQAAFSEIIPATENGEILSKLITHFLTN